MKHIKAIPSIGRQRRQLRTPNPLVRQQFISAAAELIHDEGFQALRVEEIVERAGLSIGTFYLYFQSKDDLFVSLVIDYTDRLKRRLEEAVSAEGTMMERLARALDAYLDFVKASERGFLYYHDLGNVETTVGPLSSWACDHSATALRPLLEEGMARGEIKSADPDLLAQTLVGLTQHMAGYWLHHQESYTREQVKAFLLNFVGGGLGA
ncbi:MAG TPA: TetR/AcrR family transcriptional regulator [Blastocatellia bacterium]|nr:TetR/AcrR family transcriptional regulator [Blastocatellia bacterium]